MLFEPAEVEEVAAELGDEPPHTQVLQHPFCLPDKDVRTLQLASGGHGEQLVIRHARPEEVAETARKREIVERPNAIVGVDQIDAVREVRRYEHGDERIAYRVFVPQSVLLAQRPAVREEIGALALRERAAIGTAGEIEERIQMRLLRFDLGLLDPAQFRVDPGEVLVNGLVRLGVVHLPDPVAVRVGQLEHDGLRGDLLVGWTLAFGFAAQAARFAACGSGSVPGRVVEVPSGDDFAFPLEQLLGAINSRTRIVFVTNPNNPTGLSVPREAILTVADAAPHATIFLDEAYADFSRTTLIGDPALPTRPNVLIGRTFAKAHGLAALRAGALVGAEHTISRIRKVIPPYSLNLAAAVALPAALEDTRHHRDYLRQVAESKALLYATFDRLGIKYWQSEANFILADFGKAAPDVVEGLRTRRVYVRDRSGDFGCKNCIRITAGIVEHTRQCIEAIEEVLCGAQ